MDRWDRDYGYRGENVRRRRPIGQTALLLAFSGGGMRAAALSYGVLQELRDTVVGEMSLLDEVDLITSVSGGGFTAAYYGLFGDRIFEDYEERFLRRNISRRLTLALLNPVNWFRMLTTLSRTELAVREYDRILFDRSTYGDLLERPGPYVRINATDFSITEQFTFDQPTFDRICSDLSAMKVARAVAASSAVPVAFAPVTLRNHAGRCGYETPEEVQAALTDPGASRRQRMLAEIGQSYLNTEARRYIHLYDGGLVDNLGLRVILNDVATVGGIPGQIKALEATRPSDLVVVVVDAQVNRDQDFDRTASAPGLADLLGTISGSQLNRFSFETIELMRSSLEDWERETEAASGPRVRTHLVEVSFSMSADAEERVYFNQVPTSLHLDDEEVDRLIEFGRRAFRESPDTLRLLDTLGH